MIYGYARVSTHKQAREGFSLEAQEQGLKLLGAEKIYTDVMTGATVKRDELDALLNVLESGDTLVTMKLDRIARSVTEGSRLIDDLVNRGITVIVKDLSDGKPFEPTKEGKLMVHLMLSIAEYERELIMERTRAGREVARQKPGYKEGRPPVYSKKQLDHAMQLLESNSYREVVEMTGISKATLARERARRRLATA